jgi:dipeptidyl aminopeptidase/acylaminoacyl peptidase
VIVCDPDEGTVDKVASPGQPIPARYLSSPVRIDAPSSDGAIVHGLFSPPTNPDTEGPPGQRPPLIVQPHAGPTFDAKPRLDLRVQFFTSRGFAVVAVNYRGSTGYGRAYREALVGRWGIDEVEDCIAVANHLISLGEVDPRRIAISGASAGGFTALRAAASSGLFAAVVSAMGITDLEAHRRESPRFQAHKLDRLVGTYPEAAEVYRTRSPVHHADQIHCPVLLLHGQSDSAVPPLHSRRMAEALAQAGIPYALIEISDTGHSFDQEDIIQRTLDAELEFYSSALKLPSSNS